MKTLVVAPSWIGDAVAAQPLFSRLHAAHPSAVLDVLAPAWVAPVLRRMSDVARVIDAPFAHGRLDLRARWRIGRQIAATRYDAAIVLPNSWKSALVPFFAGIPRRVGYRGEFRYGLLNEIHRLDERATPQMTQRYAALAQAPRNAPHQALAPPRLAVEPIAVRKTLAALGVASDARPIAFCPGAEYGPAKQWPASHYAELAGMLASRGHAIWLIGSAKDSDIGNAIAAGARVPCRNLCGRTSLDQAIDLLAAAHGVVTNDSGLMHVAAALDRPIVALFGSSDPRHTPPLSSRAEVLWLHLSCSPCFQRQCPLGHLRCLRDIQPKQVVARLEPYLKHE